MTVVKYSETEDSTACKLCGGSSDRNRKQNLNVSMMKDHIKGKSQNSETEKSSHVNIVRVKKKEISISAFL